MSDNRFFGTHRPWEDWLGMLLGVLIMVSPWFPMQVSDVVEQAAGVVAGLEGTTSTSSARRCVSIARRKSGVTSR